MKRQPPDSQAEERVKEEMLAELAQRKQPRARIEEQPPIARPVTIPPAEDAPPKNAEISEDDFLKGRIKELEDRLETLAREQATMPKAGGGSSSGDIWDEEEADLGGDSLLSTRFMVTANETDPNTVDVAEGMWWHPDGNKSGSATGIGSVTQPYIIVDRTGATLSITASWGTIINADVFTLAKLTYDGTTLTNIVLYHVGDFWSI